jgi:hypothetical protein
MRPRVLEIRTRLRGEMADVIRQRAEREDNTIPAVVRSLLAAALLTLPTQSPDDQREASQ